jgi:hypothetical protein
MADSIKCPHCNNEIPLTEAISHQAEERLRLQFDEERKAFESERENFAKEREQLGVEHATQLKERDAEHAALIERLREEAVASAEEKVSTELRDLTAQIEEQTVARKEAEDRELTLRREKRELEEAGASLKLEVERTLDDERGKIAAQAVERVEESYRLKLREKDLTLEQMGKRIDDLQAAAEQKRSGLQGEVLEREIEDVLREAFASDQIEPVKAGKKGADVLQRVRSARGECGSLLWESKNHKNWSPGWVDKLRADQQSARADVAIIVTSALPDGVDHVAFVEGVWVCDFASVLPLAVMLRQQLDSVRQARVITANQSRTADLAYEYLCGQEFQHFVTNTVGAALTMKRDLDSDRASAERGFKRREKHLDLQIRSLAGLYGDLQGIAGGAVQPVAALEGPIDEDEGDSGVLALAS